MAQAPLRTALIVPLVVPRALTGEDDPARRRDWPEGMPPHVTILFPFVPPELVDESVRAAIAEIAAGVPSFAVGLIQTRRFPQTLYLAPEPPDPFIEIIHAVDARFPDYPPYEGVFEEVIPHLSIATGTPRELDVAEATAQRYLPVEARATEIVLLEEAEAGGRRWARRWSVGFGSPQPQPDPK
jgi:2'-5' RNA ligase